MPEYTNWESGIQNIGCLNSGCTDNNGLVVRPDSDFAWNAYDKDSELPYICVSKCPVNFKLYPGTLLFFIVLVTKSFKLLVKKGI